MNNPNLKSIHEAKAEMAAHVARFIKQGFVLKSRPQDIDETVVLELEGRHPLLTTIRRDAGSTIVTVKEFEGGAGNCWQAVVS